MVPQTTVDRKFNFWQKWLTYANVIAIFVGIVSAFANESIILSAYNDSMRDVFFQSNALDPATLQLKNWLFGIIGATIVGFHILAVMISENAFKNRERWAYYAISFGLSSWFAIDSTISFLYGAIFNILMINIVAFAGIALPLVMTHKYFFGEHK